MSDASEQSRTAAPDELGPLIRDLGVASSWRAPRVLVPGAIGVLVGGGLVIFGATSDDGGLMVVGGLILAVIAIAALVSAFSRKVAVHAAGVLVRRRNRTWTIFWDELAAIELRLRPRNRRRKQAASTDLTLVREDGKRQRFSGGASPVLDAMAMSIERASAPVLAAKLAEALQAGHVASVGQVHFREQGWVVMNETLPWRDLESIEADDGKLYVVLASAGRHELGRFDSIPSAYAYLHLAVERARRDGADPLFTQGLLLEAGDLSDDPTVALARAIPGRRAWRQVREASSVPLW